MPRNSRPRRWFLVGAVVLVLGLAGAALAGVVARAAEKTARVTVIEREYRLIVSTHVFKPGRYAFVAVDKGRLSHALAIAGPGIKTERVRGLIKPGASRTLLVTLRSGSYRLWCPVPGHAGLGMRTTFKVGGGAASPAPAPAPATTTTAKKGGWG